MGEDAGLTLAELTSDPVGNAYWFARMLISSDQYGGLGSDTRLMTTLASALREGLDRIPDESDDRAIDLLSGIVRNVLLHGRREGTRVRQRILDLIDALGEYLLAVVDFGILALTCDKILVPVNESLKVIPSSDRVFAESIAKELLDSKGEDGLAEVVNLWDKVGAHGCMVVERDQVVESFRRLREHLEQLGMGRRQKDLLLTAFCQEFERRVAQKRKGRAGGSVESVTSFILDYYGVRASHEPEHFTTGLEIDRWIRATDGWYIGISCKRTLRERWKQAYTTDIDLLNRHKIKSLWHVVTFDRDLSDEKLVEMGSYRAVLYLPDDSPRYAAAQAHPGMSNYVRPMSRFADDLRTETN